MNRVMPWSLIFALLLVTAAAVAQTKRSLLKPPDKYRGFEIDGERYVVGEIYLKQFSDTTALKQLGFRDFEGIGSNAWHKKVKAIWPIYTDVDALPDFVEGLNYEKARNAEQAMQAYSTDCVPPSKPVYNSIMYRPPGYTPNPNYSMNVTGKSSYRKRLGDPGTRNLYSTYRPPNGSKLRMTSIGQRTIDSSQRQFEYRSNCRRCR